MKSRIILAIIAIAFTLGMASCYLPPDLSIQFTFSTSPDATTLLSGNSDYTVDITYYIWNTCGTDLDNCKIQFRIDTTGGQVDRWTPGDNISAFDPIAATGSFTVNTTNDITSVSILKAGFDNPPDKDK